MGEAKQFGGLIVKADVCYSRPATEEPKTTSFVEVDEVQLDDSLKRIFSGWMFAQSPGLNAVEHPIYDVWLINCRDPAAPPPAVEEIPDLSTLQEQIEEGEPAGLDAAAPVRSTRAGSLSSLNLLKSAGASMADGNSSL